MNRLELTFPGKQAVLVCEVLTKSSAQGKKESPINSSFLDKDLEEISIKLKLKATNLQLDCNYKQLRATRSNYVATDLQLKTTNLQLMYN